MEQADKQSSVIFNVFSLYKKYGHNDYLGEPVNQLEHAIQCAMLAEKEGYSNEVRCILHNSWLSHDVINFSGGQLQIDTQSLE